MDARVKPGHDGTGIIFASIAGARVCAFGFRA
jgi:hypothetical protein